MLGYLSAITMWDRGMRDGGEEKGGVARRVVGQERPQVLADGVLYYMYAKHRDTVTRTQTNVFIFKHFNPFYCTLKYIFLPVTMVADMCGTFVVIYHALVLNCLH